MIALSWFLLAAAPSEGSVVEVAPADRFAADIEAAAPIRLWLNNSRQFREGDKARVQVETEHDGYLVVFNYDTDGRLRVIFPVDPGDDNFVRGGRRYEIRGRGDRESFIVGQEGEGTVYAAVSADPFRFDEIESGGNWDYGRVNIQSTRDPEADVTELLQRMASDRGFDYDLLSYNVYGYRSTQYVNAWYPRPYGYWDDYYCDPYYRPSLFGCRYYPVGGWYLGHSPYRYGYYGYRSWWHDPFYRNRSVYYGGRNYRNYPVVAGRPRGYTIVRRNPSSSYNGRFGSWGGSIGGNGRTRPNVDYRPRANRPDNDDRGRPNGSAGRPSNPSGNVRPNNPSGDRPRARRSPPSQDLPPMVERERPGERGSVDFGGQGRRSAGSDESRRPAGFDESRRSRGSDDTPRVDVPARRSGGDDGPRVERPRSSEPRFESRGADRRPEPRAEPRSSPPPRAEPRSSPPPRAESPRSSPPPRTESSRPRSNDRPRGGGGGGGRGRGRP